MNTTFGRKALQTLEIGETQNQTQTAKQPKARSLLAKVRTPLTYEEVVERLEELGYEPYESGYGVRSRCPVHQGEGHSLTVNPKDDDSGGVLIHCFARKCDFGRIVAALNLDGDDRPDVPITPRQVPPPTIYPTLDAALSAIGEGEGATVWKYHREDGTPCGAQVRIDLPGGRKEFRPVHLTAEGAWVIRAHPDPRPLYRLPELVGEASSVVFVAEGEKCADRLAALGKVSTTSQGGALSPSKSDWSPLSGRDVVILPDNDEPGEGYAEAVCGILAGLSPPARVRIVRLPGLEPSGDVADWRVDESLEARRAALDALVDSSELVKPEALSKPARAPERPSLSPLRIDARPASSYRLKPVRYLAKPHLPTRCVVLLASPGGLGKSYLTVDTAARLSTGRPCFGQGHATVGPVNTLFLAGEDDRESILAPRLLAAGADMDRIEIVEGLKDDDGNAIPFDVSYIPVLREFIARRREEGKPFRFIVIDPITTYVGRAGVDDHRDNQLKPVMADLANLAQDEDLTILCIAHVNKSSGRSASQRVLGGAAYVTGPRMTYVLGIDPSDPDLRILAPSKQNLPIRPPSIAFRLEMLDRWEAYDILSEYAV